MAARRPHHHLSAGPRAGLAVRLDIDLRPFRYLGAAMLALAVTLPHLPGDPGLPCPLRTVTGVPCPMCGLTTSVKAAMAGKVHAALAANPVGLVAVAVAVVLLVRPGWRRLTVPAALVVGVAAASWLFQLHRFHLI